MKIEPKGGINTRKHPHDVGIDQFISMQNYDMGKWNHHHEHYKLIQGSTKYHGTSLGTNAATHLTVHYDNSLGTAQVIACVDDKILRKVQGTNEFETLMSGLTPNKITSSVNVFNRTYFAHPVDGIIEYDGFTASKVNGSPKLSSIIFSKEANRAFGIDAGNPDSYLFTDDVSTTGGVPVNWNPLNADVVPSDEGDIEEALFLLKGRLIHLRTNGIWIYYIGGGPTSWRAEKASTDVGCIAFKTAKMVNNEIWFLGHSTKVGIGVFAFNGSESRIISFDVEPTMYRINPYRIKEACAEYVGNLYKLSFSIDADIENNHTLHFDTIYNNKETNLPCVYGIHTYGFESSCVLNTRLFSGEHIFARKYNGGSWVFKADDVYTQYGDNSGSGEIIEGEILTPIYEDAGEDIGWDYFKRFEKFMVAYPPSGTWNMRVDAFVDYKTNPEIGWNLSLEGDNLSIDDIILGTNPLDAHEQSFRIKTVSFLGRAIQFRMRNSVKNQPSEFSGLAYDVRPVRRMKNAQVL